MPNNIKQILNELYLIEPELKQHEEALEKLVTELLNTKPDTKFDPAFARKLKQMILSEEVSTAPKYNFFSNMSMQRLAFAFGGLALVVILVVVGTSQTRKMLPAKVVLGDQRISKLSMGAFGPLSSNGSGGAQNMAKGAVGTGESAPSAVSRDQAAVSSPKAFGLGGGGGGVSASPMMAPYQIYNYKYVYKGNLVELKDATLDVYKRVSPSPASAESLLGMNFGVNLQSFAGAKLNSFEVSQKNVKDGYAVYVNAADGQVSIYQNWETWDNPCKNGVCTTPEPLKLEQLPPDASVISMADKFLSDHGISTQNYDKGELDNEWRNNLKMAASSVPGSEPEKLLPYVPDTLTVVYPLKLNGQRVTENGGGARGIRVAVDVRKNKVTSVWGVMTQDYQSSAYDAETSWDRMVKIAEQGGVYGSPIAMPYYGEGVNVKDVTVELGTPKRVLTAVWSQNGEVIAPALEFPIIQNENTQQLWQKSITIPLVKELLNVNNGASDGGPVRIMNSAGSVEGSVGAAVTPTAVDTQLPIVPKQ